MMNILFLLGMAMLIQPETSSVRTCKDHVPSRSEEILSVLNVRKTYADRIALDNISLTVRSGECLGMLGPNGAGKTTTILIICGLLSPDSGDITVGFPPLPPSTATARKAIGYVPQEIALYEDLTGRENLIFFGRLYGLRPKLLRPRTSELLDSVGLAARADDRVARYSGGMKRRLNIAAALLHDPKLLVLDEPTVGIDPQSRDSILERLSELRAGGMALLYTSHYMPEAESICTRVVVMDHGRILASGTPGELTSRFGNQANRLTLSFTGSPAVAAPELSAIRGVLEVACSEQTLEICVTDVAIALPKIFSTLAEKGLRSTDLSMTKVTLADVFMQLTGKALRDE